MKNLHNRSEKKKVKKYIPAQVLESKSLKLIDLEYSKQPILLGELKKSKPVKQTKNTVLKGRKYDLNLLKQVMSVQTVSHNDEAMMSFIKDFLFTLKKSHKQYIELEEDSYGNIYVTKGKASSYPAIVSHTDTVHSIVKDYRVYQQGDILFAFSSDKLGQVGIGGDDKVGVFTCLQALIDLEYLKVVFYRNEEVGCIGSRHSIDNHKEWYKDCNFVLQCDRKNTTDFITQSGGIQMCSENFLNSCLPFMNEHGFVKATGLSTDVDKLVRAGIGVSCVNISSAYFNPHSSWETVSVSGIGCTYSLVYDICTNLGDTKFEYKYVAPVYPSYPRGTYNSFGDFNMYGKISVTKTVACDEIFEIRGMSPVSTTKTCTHCGGIMEYDVKENVFECEKCGILEYDQDMFKDFIIKVKYGNKEEEFYFSWLFNGYVPKKKALWINKYKSYVPRKQYVEEWELEES
jgi:hypothetical protein